MDWCYLYLEDNILEFGYATLEEFFSFAPWVLMFLDAAITMRSFSEEFKGGTFEILRTRPLSSWQIVTGKFFGLHRSIDCIYAYVGLLFHHQSSGCNNGY